MGEIVYELTWIDLVLCIVKQLFFYVVIDGGVIAVILFSPKMKKWSKVVCSILTEAAGRSITGFKRLMRKRTII